MRMVLVFLAILSWVGAVSAQNIECPIYRNVQIEVGGKETIRPLFRTVEVYFEGDTAELICPSWGFTVSEGSFSCGGAWALSGSSITIDVTAIGKYMFNVSLKTQKKYFPPQMVALCSVPEPE